jgi:hypothetical protein
VVLEEDVLGYLAEVELRFGGRSLVKGLDLEAVFGASHQERVMATDTQGLSERGRDRNPAEVLNLDGTAGELEQLTSFRGSPGWSTCLTIWQ